MRDALERSLEMALEIPAGMGVRVRVDAETGLLADVEQADVIFGTFRADHVPTRRARNCLAAEGVGTAGVGSVRSPF